MQNQALSRKKLATVLSRVLPRSESQKQELLQLIQAKRTKPKYKLTAKTK